jgi:hypothetical protein
MKWNFTSGRPQSRPTLFLGCHAPGSHRAASSPDRGGAALAAPAGLGRGRSRSAWRRAAARAGEVGGQGPRWRWGVLPSVRDRTLGPLRRLVATTGSAPRHAACGRSGARSLLTPSASRSGLGAPASEGVVRGFGAEGPRTLVQTRPRGVGLILTTGFARSCGQCRVKSPARRQMSTTSSTRGSPTSLKRKRKRRKDPWS